MRPRNQPEVLMQLSKHHSSSRVLVFLFSLTLGGLTLSGCGEDLSDYAEEAGGEAPAQIVAQSVPAGYYDSTKGKTGLELLSALADRVYNGHRALSYSAARDQLFGNVADWDNDDVVPCVYTGRLGKPVTNTSTASSLDFNTEHTWPQSLGATGAAQTDLNHLFPTDETANGRRGNYPFGVVAKGTWTAPNPDGTMPSRLGTDASGRTVFEPHDSSKGNIARAIFYFYTRYASRRPSKFTLNNFNVEEATLRRWHEMDPPDAEERARNDLVFGIQGNRNPYLDHPEFVSAIPDFP
jgi:endonuclease I